ncbi:MAG: Stage III sporulation protein AA [Clostridia bacterium 41_269]|nr:MAG: Stage III sporulation protein AA [Clostridia bacterium 41_269]
MEVISAKKTGINFKERVLDKRILEICSPMLRTILERLPTSVSSNLQELRLRQERPLCLRCIQDEFFVTHDGRVTRNPREAYFITKSDIEKIFLNLTRSSVYTLDEELRSGFITISGGHRVGFTGEAVLQNGKVKSLKNISSLNIRISREIKGCADLVLPLIIDIHLNTVYHTLIISPPGCGKTTLLRDIVRQISNGIQSMGFRGVNVGLVDERSEIAACYNGQPQNDVGLRTDVLDRCPKAEGMYMLVRSMAPHVIATDELGRAEDIAAVEEVLNAGIKLITTVHGIDLDDIKKRPVIDRLLRKTLFNRIIILSSTKSVGTVEDVLDGSNGKSLLEKGKRGDKKL